MYIGELAPVTDILSMNEDELQEYIGERIDLLDPGGCCQSNRVCI